MPRYFLNVGAAALLALLSQGAMAVALVCDAQPAQSADTARSERLIWNYYDYWYSGIYVSDATGAEEIVPTNSAYSDTDLVRDVATESEMLAGFPASWNVDSFVSIDCVAADVNAKPDDVADPTAEDTTANELQGPIALLCDATTGCSELPSAAGTSAAQEPPPFVDPDRRRRSALVVFGVIQTLGDGVLVVLNDTGRYFNMVLPADVDIERHTVVNLAALTPGDIVGAVLGPAGQSARGATELRVYRGSLRETITPSPLTDDSALPAGVELRGIVRNVASRPDGRALRIGYAAREGNVPVPSDVPVTIIEAARRADLKPFSVPVRVIAQQQEDGSLLVRSIDIL